MCLHPELILPVPEATAKVAKAALYLKLEDDGFDFSVLSEFRDRLIKGSREKQILDKMLLDLVNWDYLNPKAKLVLIRLIYSLPSKN